MQKRVLGGLQAAAAVLLASGALVGVAPVPLHQFGCPSAFGIMTVESGSDFDTIVVCSSERSQRQIEAAALLALGGALLAGASYVRVDPQRRASNGAEVPVDTAQTDSSTVDGRPGAGSPWACIQTA